MRPCCLRGFVRHVRTSENDNLLLKKQSKNLKKGLLGEIRIVFLAEAEYTFQGDRG
jgi:hypothetical protein